MWSPALVCVVGEGGARQYRVGHEVVDQFLEFVAARARPNTVKAYAHDLKVFFTVVAKEPVEVTGRYARAGLPPRTPRAPTRSSPKGFSCQSLFLTRA